MKTPWDNEPTPLTDARTPIRAGSPTDFVSARFARELERRMRHAERLLEESPMYIQFGTFKEFDAKVRAHLTAAAKENQ